MTTDSSEPATPTGERALAAVPVVLTVMATILAGLSSSEMTQSMYFRSLAAQNQAKAGSQWGFFQAKRIRGTTMESGGELVRMVSDVEAFDAGKMQSVADRVEAAIGQAAGPSALGVRAVAKQLRDRVGRASAKTALGYLAGSDLPTITEKHVDDEALRAVVKAVEVRQTEAQTVTQVLRVPPARIEEALDAAETNASVFDEACKPITAEVSGVEKGLADLVDELRKARFGTAGREAVSALDEAANAVRPVLAGFRAAKLDFTARRYAQEAKYNQESAELLEVLARRNGAESDRHRNRSRNFFYAMLCAQAGVTIASFALARSRKSWFWAVAGGAGVIAVTFGAYVYLAL